MNEDLPESVELVQAIIHVADLCSGVAQADIIAAVHKTDGVHSVTAVEGDLHIVYDPLLTTEKELEAAIRSSGHPTQGGEAERDSPFA